MNLELLMNLSDMPSWRLLKNEMISKEFTSLWKDETPLGSYSLVHVVVDGSQQPVTMRYNQQDTDSYLAFTSPELFERLLNDYQLSSKELLKGEKTHDLDGKYKLKVMMVGELINTLGRRNKETSIKINPLPVKVGEGVESLLFCEEVLFAPQFDEFTCKRLLTDPDDAKALMAINPDDEARFGINIIFYMLTNSDLPEEGEEREKGLIEKVEELAFKAPRVPIKRGSGSFLAVLLNLESEIEERAFIRDYSTFDRYSDLVFVTSSLKIWTGKLEEIHFHGEKIDTIFAPLIKWQQGKKKHIPYFKES